MSKNKFNFQSFAYIAVLTLVGCASTENSSTIINPPVIENSKVYNSPFEVVLKATTMIDETQVNNNLNNGKIEFRHAYFSSDAIEKDLDSNYGLNNVLSRRVIERFIVKPISSSITKVEITTDMYREVESTSKFSLLGINTYPKYSEEKTYSNGNIEKSLFNQIQANIPLAIQIIQLEKLEREKEIIENEQKKIAADQKKITDEKFKNKLLADSKIFLQTNDIKKFVVVSAQSRDPSVPGAVICKDYDSVKYSIRFFRIEMESQMRAQFMGGRQEKLLHGEMPESSTILKKYGCYLLQPETRMLWSGSYNPPEVIFRKSNGNVLIGVTDPSMIKVDK